MNSAVAVATFGQQAVRVGANRVKVVSVFDVRGKERSRNNQQRNGACSEM